MNAANLAECLINYYPSEPLKTNLLFYLLNSLSHRECLSCDQISSRLGYSREKLDELLNTIPAVETNEAGNIISAAGLSLRKTSYLIDCNKGPLYAQSGLDAVIVRTLLLTQMSVEHKCLDNHHPVCLRFGFDQAFMPLPDQAVITIPSRKALLKNLHGNHSEYKLFPNPDSARRWLWQHEDGFILSVKNVFIAAVQLRQSLMRSSTSMLSAPYRRKGSSAKRRKV